MNRIIFSATTDTIFTPAFQLNPKKWLHYFKTLLDREDLEKLDWSTLVERIYDAYRSVKSVVQQDLYIWSNPVPRLDKSQYLRRLLTDSRLDQDLLTLLTKAKKDYQDYRVQIRQIGENSKNRNQPIEERRQQAIEINQKLENIRRVFKDKKLSHLSILKEKIQRFDSLIQQIPDEDLNINHEEFKDKFDLMDAHHDYTQARTLSRIIPVK